LNFVIFISTGEVKTGR